MARTEPDGSGHYEVEVARSGRYEITFRFGPPGGQEIPAIKAGKAYLSLGDVLMEKSIENGAASVTFNVHLTAGHFRLDPLLTGQRTDQRAVSPFLLDVRRMDI